MRQQELLSTVEFPPLMALDHALRMYKYMDGASVLRTTEYGIRNTDYGIRNTEYGIHYSADKRSFDYVNVDSISYASND
jgi:hypothetical protein